MFQWPKILNVNSNEPLFYPYSTEVNKCSGSCNNINDPYAKLRVPDVVKNIMSKHVWNTTYKMAWNLQI